MVIPLMIWIALLLVAGGMLVFWLGTATDLRTQAQNAADAAALGGEKELMRELYIPSAPDLAQITGAAERYAAENYGTVIGPGPGAQVELVPSVAGYDVRVEVRTGQSLPSNSPDAGGYAVAGARASTNPFASSKPSLSVSLISSASATQCQDAGSGDASVGAGNRAGPPFQPHGGQFGFFPATGTDYHRGCEATIAAALDSLGKARKVHLTGSAGARGSAQSVSGGASANDPHSCGAASTTLGLPPGISGSELLGYGLTRPDPTKPQEIQLSGSNLAACAAQAAGPAQLATQSVPTGNPNIHLVPWDGGPVGTLGGWSMLGLGASGGWVIPWPIVNCESGGANLPPNYASASGYYQITSGTWAGFAGYPAANLAPKAVQDAKARQLVATRGLQPWDCARILHYV